MNELRRDYFTDNWVIIATDRVKRPNDYKNPKPRSGTENNYTFCGRHAEYVHDTSSPCAFCPGFEHMTPPSKASYFLCNGTISYDADMEGRPPRTGWIERVIPNMYPAVIPEGARARDGCEMPASGVHEVIVESPEHNRHPQSMSDDEIRLLFRVYRDRFSTAAGLPYIRYISIFRNYGKEAGASLSHAHSQLIAIPVVPGVIRAQYGLDYTSVIGKEEKSPRLVTSSMYSVSFAPYASSYPYEVWIFPRRRCRNIMELSNEERDDLAITCRGVLSKMSRLLSNPPYNYAFVQSVSSDMHMHLRIYPKLGTAAGFELNTDMHINSVLPEEAARDLREI